MADGGYCRAVGPKVRGCEGLGVVVVGEGLKEVECWGILRSC